jgi:subtilisin family serine protease
MVAMPRVLSLLLTALISLPIVTAAPVEPSGEFYYNAGRRITVVRSSTRLAMLSGDASRVAPLAGVAKVRDLQAGGLAELTLSTAAAKAPPAELATAVEAAGGTLLPVFFEPGAERDASTLFITDELLVRFRPELSLSAVDALAARYGAEIVAPLGYAPNGFRLRVAASGLERNAMTVANAFYETGACLWAHPNFLASRTPRLVPNDPQYPNQWHLSNTGQSSGTVGADVKAEAAWEITQGSPDISIAVADTGIDYEHVDFNVPTDEGLPKVHSPRDVVHGDDDPSPQPADANIAHGTAAAGVAVAEFNNNLGTAGIAPKCRFIPIQLYAESTFTPNSTEADAFTWAADHGAAVMSNSWGPDNDDTPLPDATREAIDYATTTGRGGLGTVIFFAAGNSNDDTVHDNYISYSKVVAVAASTNFDMRAGYSRFGRAISIAAPSNGGSLGITTTDVTGAGGYSSGDFTPAFGGTSSACPLAAGVAALVLSVAPDLTWQEVKAVLEETADKIDPSGGDYDETGRSDQYGYGRVNALRAVELARELGDPTATRAQLSPLPAPAGAGAPLTLGWSVTGANEVTAQALEFSADGGPFQSLATVAPADRAFAWTVPDTVVQSLAVRLTVTNTAGAVVTTTATTTVWAKPAIVSAKLKRAASGKRQLVVDGAAFRVDESILFVGDTPLGSLKYPKGRRTGDGTCTRIVSTDAALANLVPTGATVTITVRHMRTGQVSEGFSYTR